MRRSAPPAPRPAPRAIRCLMRIEMLRRGEPSSAPRPASIGAAPVQGASRLGAARSSEARRRHQPSALPGELIHIDVKKLRRSSAAGHRRHRQAPQRPDARRSGRRRTIVGSSRHTAIDDSPRLASPRCYTDEKATPVADVPRGAPLAFFERHGISRQQLLTDNASAIAQRSTRRLPAPGSAICAPAPTGPDQRQGERSTARLRAARPTADYRETASAPRPLTHWLGTTTITEDTQPIGHQAADLRLSANHFRQTLP